MGEKLRPLRAVGDPTPAHPLSIHARIQAHPSRRELRQRLLEALPDAEVVETDFDPPNPWMGYRACLAAPPDGTTHLLIVQDDALPCRNVSPALHVIAAQEPDVPIVLYLGMLPPQKKPALLAGKAGERYVTLHPSGFLPVVAVLWPVAKAAHFLEWAGDPRILRRKNGQQIIERSDDAMGGRWMKATRQRIVATIPSLFEHPDDNPSTIGRKPGGRTALFWHGPEWDAMSVDW